MSIQEIVNFLIELEYDEDTKLGSNRTKRFRDVIDRNRIKEQLDSYRDKTRYNRKSLSVICDGGLGYTFTEVLDFIRCVESDMNKSIIDL